MLEKNQVVSAAVEGYSAEGLGIARVDGQVVFVHDGVQGETCDVLLMKIRRREAFGKVVSVAEPSPHRVEPDCPYYRLCGGCDFRHVDYEEELSAKRERVQSALQRLGGSDVTVEEILAAPAVDGYRNKSIFTVDGGGNVGFFRARTHQVQNVEKCRLQKDTAASAAEALRQFMAKYHVPGYDESTRKGLLRHLFIRTNAKGECLICVMGNGQGAPHEKELAEAFRGVCPDCVGVVWGVLTGTGNTLYPESYRTLWGEDTLTDTLCGLTFRLSVPSFYQVNREQAERLYTKAVEFADLRGTETVLDLYCGAGTITQVMARHCGRAIGAEIVPSAIENAKKTAAENGIDNVEFFCGDAADVSADFAAKGLHPDVICVDPPRKGLAPEVIEQCAAMKPERIVYVSCDPATLGRDVKRFAELGYVCTRAAAADLFPRTHHVESVVLLIKAVGS